MPDEVLEIVRTGDKTWLALEEGEPYELTTDTVVHYLLGRTAAEPHMIRVIDPFKKEIPVAPTEDTG